MARPRRLAFSCFIALASGALPLAAQRTIHVDDDAPPGGDGTSWPAAFASLQDALGAADVGDELRVAVGVYTADEGSTQIPGDRTASFVVTGGVTLRGGFRGLAPGGDADDRDPELFPTRLSGDLSGNDGPDFLGNEENSLNVVRLAPGTGAAVLDGLMIQNGNGDGAPSPPGAGLNGQGVDLLATDCTFRACDRRALVVSDGTAGLHGCRFEGNRSLGGGGALAAFDETLELVDCLFDDNHNGVNAGEGGAALIDQSSARFIGCRFSSNRSREHGGAIGSTRGDLTLIACAFEDNVSVRSGGAVFHHDCCNTGPFVTRLEDCLFRNNQTVYHGGAVMIDSMDTAELVRCVFVDNRTSSPDDGNAGGGGLWSRRTDTHLVSCVFLENRSARNGGGLWTNRSARIENCLFSGNVALSGGGGGIHVDAEGDGPRVLIACTIVQNRSTANGGGVHSESDPVDLSNCVLYGNVAGGAQSEAAQIASDGAPPSLSYCCVQGWTGGLGGKGNFGDDPQFVDALGPDGSPDTGDEDFKLAPGSPCIDSGSNAALPMDELDLDGDGDRFEPLPLDISGHPRVVRAPQEGQPTSDFDGVVDLGAYERQRCATANYCTAGANSVGDGAILGATGETRLSSANWTLTVMGAPPGALGLFVYGAARTALPFGDGTLCIAPGGLSLFRLDPPIQVDAAGTASRAIDFDQPPTGDGPGAIRAGSIWHFQFWYRDPSGPGGSGFNLSDALSASFCL